VQCSFVVGGAIPLVVLLIPHLSSNQRLIGVAVAFTIGLALFGFAGAKGGGSPVFKSIARVLVGGWFAMGVSYAVGRLFGTPV